MLAGLLALTAIVGLHPQGAPQRYKIDIKMVNEVDLSAMGQGKQPAELTASAWITLTMSDTAGGQIAAIVVDSVTTAPVGLMAPNFPPETAPAARGVTFRMYVVDGKVKGPVKPSVEGNAAVALVQQGVAMLFPGPKAGLKTGDTWSDTNKVDTSSEAATQTGSVVTNWKVLSVDGAAYNLEGAMGGTVTAEQGGGQMTISTKQTGTSTVKTGPKGPAAAASLSMKTDATIVVQAAPDPIAMVGTTTVTVTSIP